MKSKTKIFIVIIILLQLVVNVYLIAEKDNFQELKEEMTIPVRKHENAISMMLETEAGSGNYEMTTRDSWPTEGYIFNSTLSKCENGGEINWDDENKKVLMSGNTSDKCYVYFDKEEENIQFYLNDVLFQAKPNMTWEEWLNSNYSDGWEYKGKTLTYDEIVKKNGSTSCIPVFYGNGKEAYFVFNKDGYPSVLIIYTSKSYKTDYLAGSVADASAYPTTGELIKTIFYQANTRVPSEYVMDSKDNYYYVEAGTYGSGC